MLQWERYFKRRANDGPGDPRAGGGDSSAGGGGSSAGGGGSSAGDGNLSTGGGGDNQSTGDGDNNPSTGDGNPSTEGGVGNPSTEGGGDNRSTGDGNPSTGDGDGNPSTGDGNPPIEGGGGNPSTAGGNRAPSSNLEFDYMLGYPTTTEQMQEYWRMIGWSANETFRLDKYYILEKALVSAELPRGGQETWLLMDPGSHNVVYTGASVYHRQGLVSTTKGGAKLVRATVISQVVTDFGHRSCGLATHFLKLLAEQMDNRVGEEHIAFSVLYSGPKTDLFQRCGWRPLLAKQLRIALGDLQHSALERDYFDRYPKYYQYTKHLFWEHLISWHREYNGLSMMAMSAVKHSAVHAQIVLSNYFIMWHLRRVELRQTILRKQQQHPFVQIKASVGASFIDVKSNTTISAFWVHEFAKRRLYVGCMDVRRRDGMEGGIRMVLSMAIQAACRHGLREIILWDPSAQIVEQAERLAAEIGHGVTATWENRYEMIPCFRWHGGESKEVIWTESGYFGAA